MLVSSVLGGSALALTSSSPSSSSASIPAALSDQAETEVVVENWSSSEHLSPTLITKNCCNSFVTAYTELYYSFLIFSVTPCSLCAQHMLPILCTISSQRVHMLSSKSSR